MIGLARQATSKSEPLVDAMLHRIQNDLFDLGADLCTPDRGDKLEFEPLRIIQAQVDRLEAEIDELNSSLEPLRSFVLPGGSEASAALHVARTVARRAERLIVELSLTEGESVGGPALKYINRLSDFLFVAARYVNSQGKGDILWVPGKNR
jgi:cob(I)alamin adenosyltransferase